MIFAEVKTRTSLEYGEPLEAVNRIKVSKIKKVASLYITSNRLSGYDPSFNIISIVAGRNFIEEIAMEKNMLLQEITSCGALKDSKRIKIEHIENAF